MNFGAIGRELQSRGHRFTFFHVEEFRELARTEGAGFCALPGGAISLAKYLGAQSSEKPFSIRDFLDHAVLFAKSFCDTGPAAFRDQGIDCLLIDVLEPGGATAAELAGIPFVTICNALPLHSDASVPPDFIRWEYHDHWLARTRNTLGYAIRDIAIRPLHKVLNSYRRQAALPSYSQPEDSFSNLAQISQIVPEFEFPKRQFPNVFHCVGPYRRTAGQQGSFPYERLNGRPLVYASLGTSLGARTNVWQAIFKGCRTLDVQLVVSLGGQGNTGNLDSASPDTIVVNYAPQMEIIARSTAVITHGGLNSMLEILSLAVPVVVIPMIGDQFGVAARVRHHRLGEVLEEGKLTEETVRSALKTVLNSEVYRRNQLPIQASITRTRGVLDAADIIEEVLATGRPVHTTQRLSRRTGVERV